MSKTPSGSSRVCLYMSNKILARIDAAAHSLHMNRSEYMRIAVDKEACDVLTRMDRMDKALAAFADKVPA